jgi:hypothetical protein
MNGATWAGRRRRQDDFGVPQAGGSQPFLPGGSSKNAPKTMKFEHCFQSQSTQGALRRVIIWHLKIVFEKKNSRY